jgi:hypothetical protein
VDELVQMRRRQIAIATGMQSAAASDLRALVGTVNRLDELAQRGGIQRAPYLKTKDLIRLVEAGAKLERINRDLPSEILDLRTPEGTVEDKRTALRAAFENPEVGEMIVALASKMAGGKGGPG